MLDRLLREVLCLSIDETYATNIFPFIKPDIISSQIPLVDVIRAAREFTVPELRLARPSKVLPLGKMPSAALRKLWVNFMSLPHPAARISFSAQMEIWLRELSSWI
jgi:hypothetical protein